MSRRLPPHAEFLRRKGQERGAEALAQAVHNFPGSATSNAQTINFEGFPEDAQRYRHRGRGQ
jgi:hypothetical protein